ncbi:MAG: hypothetical protein K0S74_1785 [Chlamydiales bacterium]|jgi:1-aminocyclopropane-1-carboxylate deaminase/D-cysteine desulfhydrase-like pyridoxal-dependent ACC family enzyme|nr:hypothetical protein [Chlamydiales bacterium]
MNQTRLSQIQSFIQKVSFTTHNLHSRVHSLRSFYFPSTLCYVKREDELSFGISGTKLRKYASLIPNLKQKGIEEVILIGGTFSNNILAGVQVLVENGIKPTLFLLGPPSSEKIQGNYLFTNLFITPSDIHWIARQDWKQVTTYVQSYAEQQVKKGIRTFILREGGSVTEALPGALTLGLDIIRNEKEQNLNFDHIWIDSGTGFTAASLIAAFHYLQKPTQIHVLLLADDETYFRNQVAIWQQELERLLGNCTDNSSPQFKCYIPSCGRSFGSTNATAINTIKEIAKTEGFLIDPIYSAKLFYEAKRLIPSLELLGNHLIIHSGGALTLSGFQDLLK